MNETLAETNEIELETLAIPQTPRNIREYQTESVQPNTPGSLKRKTRADNEEDEEMTSGWISNILKENSSSCFGVVQKERSQKQKIIENFGWAICDLAMHWQ